MKNKEPLIRATVMIRGGDGFEVEGNGVKELAKRLATVTKGKDDD